MKIPLFKIYWDKKDIEAVTSVIKQGSYWASGSISKEFEKKIGEYLGEKYVTVFNSGGSALHALMLAHRIRQGDEVIVPAFTFIATAFAPLWVGARPVFADIEEETFALDPEDVMEKITPKTRAIMPIHYGGIPAKTITALKEIAEDHNLILIEDAAESFGAKLNNKFVGTFGDSAIFSLCQNKVFTTGEGGIAITKSKEIYEKLQRIKTYGRVSRGNYFSGQVQVDYVELGYNWRMPEMLAALGISQLEKVDENIKKRRQVAYKYTRELKKINWIIPPKEPENSFCVYQMYTIRVLNGMRDKLQEHLKKAEISTKVYFDPLYKYSVFRKLGYSNVRLEITEKLSIEVLTLPLYPDMKEEEQKFVIESILNF